MDSRFIFFYGQVIIYRSHFLPSLESIQIGVRQLAGKPSLSPSQREGLRRVLPPLGGVRGGQLRKFYQLDLKSQFLAIFIDRLHFTDIRNICQGVVSQNDKIGQFAWL